MFAKMVAVFVFIQFNEEMNSHDSPWNTVLSPYSEHAQARWVDQCHVVAGQTYQQTCSWDLILRVVQEHEYPSARLGYALGKWLDISIGTDCPTSIWPMSETLLDMTQPHYDGLFAGLQEYMCKTHTIYQRQVQRDVLYPWFLWWCKHFKMTDKTKPDVWSWWHARLGRHFFPDHAWACFARHAGLRPFDAYHIWNIRWSNHYLEHEDYRNYDALSNVFSRLDYFVQYVLRTSVTGGQITSNDVLEL